MARAEGVSAAAGANTSGVTAGSALLSTAMGAAQALLDSQAAGAALREAVRSTRSLEDLPQLQATMRAVGAAAAAASHCDTFRCAHLAFSV